MRQQGYQMKEHEGAAKTELQVGVMLVSQFQLTYILISQILLENEKLNTYLSFESPAVFH